MENASWITAEINMATSHGDLEKELASYRFAGDFEKPWQPTGSGSGSGWTAFP